jgi:tripartite-type tricarboxylate transporter receptor subunit TctC
MHISTRRLGFLFGAAAMMGCVSAHAETTEEFYKGKSIALVVSADAGTGYDLYARNIARHWPRHIPGAPAMNVQNMASAGGMTATNYLYNVAPKNGLTLGLIQATVPFEPLFENKQAAFDPLKFNWLGTPGQETSVLFVWHDIPVTNMAEAKARGLTLGATGGASTPAFFARVLTAIFDVPIKLIVGYKSQAESFLAMERGENEGYPSTFYSSLKGTQPGWITEKKVRFLLQYGSAPNREMPNVPFAPDLISKPDDKLLMQIASAPLALGRPMLAPPGTPEDRVAALRTSLQETFRDPAYLADCAKQDIACDAPVTADQITDVLKASYAAPAPILKRLLAIYANVK